MRVERACSELRVILAQDNRTRDEVFAGVAGDEAGERHIATLIDSAEITCWTQRVPFDGTNLDPGTLVYIVFEGGPPQDEAKIDWDFIPSAEPIGAFTAEADAQSLCAARDQTALERHVWRVPIGWYDTRLKP